MPPRSLLVKASSFRPFAQAPRGPFAGLFRGLGFGLIVAGAVAGAGCGPVQAKYRFDDAALASVSVQDKQPIFAAEQEVSVAKARREETDRDVKKAEDAVATARLGVEKAKLDAESAAIEKKLASDAKDAPRIQVAAEKDRVALLGKQAAEAHLHLANEQRKWRDKLRDEADAEVHATLAKVEMQKAQLAVARNIRPQGFNPDQFMNEFTSRQRKVDDLRRDADEKKLDCDKAAMDYNNANSLYQQAAGVPATPAYQSPAQPGYAPPQPVYAPPAQQPAPPAY